jgi:phosphoribosylamine--glycine ligase
MRVLVLGSGGREHALVWKLSQSPKVDQIFCIPGNPGISEMAQCVELPVNDNDKLLQFALESKIDLTVVGPEAILANGVVDTFAAAGLKIFGPSQAAACIESSKAFAKEIMKKYGIPTAQFEIFTDAEKAKEYIRSQGAPIVVKADGLAAGKGVIVAMTVSEALAAVERIMCGKAFGQAGSQVVIEEFLSGEEVSLMAFSDGETVVPMVAAQDHKRAQDGDQGPNTGGMGAYAPAPVLTPDLLRQAENEILKPLIRAMAAEGCLYKGCLYAGLILTKQGPKVIEFNARFGDPETQVVLPLLDNDLLAVMEACIDGGLDGTEVKWKKSAAVCVVMAAGGYPGIYETGAVISGLEEAGKMGSVIFHAGTARCGQNYVTGGGRVLGVTAMAETVSAAIGKTYQAVAKIQFENMHYRKDIGDKASKSTPFRK